MRRKKSWHRWSDTAAVLFGKVQFLGSCLLATSGLGRADPFDSYPGPRWLGQVAIHPRNDDPWRLLLDSFRPCDWAGHLQFTVRQLGCPKCSFLQAIFNLSTGRKWGRLEFLCFWILGLGGTRFLWLSWRRWCIGWLTVDGGVVGFNLVRHISVFWIYGCPHKIEKVGRQKGEKKMFFFFSNHIRIANCTIIEHNCCERFR